MARGGRTGSRPSEKAPYASDASRTSTSMLHPSLTTWCMVKQSTHSLSPSRSSAARRSGPRDRSKGRVVSWWTWLRMAASRSGSGRPASSTVGITTGTGGWTSATVPPSAARRTVRSASWRRTTSVSARWRARTSSGPWSRSATGTLYAALPGSSWSRNQSRCCAKESGNTEGRRSFFCRSFSARSRRFSSTGRGRGAEATRSASRATVCASKTARSGISTPSASRTRDTTLVASRECPPSSKKSSSTPTRSAPSTSAQTPASVSSVGFRGAT